MATYNRSTAVTYAKGWWNSTNPMFGRMSNDCTNFVSQCVFAGGWPMVGSHNVLDRAKDNQWWFGGSRFTTASYTWGGAQNFYRFLSVSGRGSKLFEIGAECVEEIGQMRDGDVVQMKDATGHVYHTMLVTGRDGADLLLTYHTSDHLDKKMSAITLSAGHKFVGWKLRDTI
jgi:Putative amidase domain